MELTTTPLAAWGIPGFIILVMAGVIVYQNKKIEFLYKEKNELQERRLTEAETRADKYNQAMGEFSETSKLLLAKLSGIK